MKANELRIGNYVILKDKGLYQVSTGHDIDELTDWDDSDYLNGVPLTVEWLHKFRFTEKEDYLYNAERGPVFTLNDVNILYHRDEFNYGVEVYDGGAGQEWSFLTDIKYVHQLQNLYFALTGGELQLTTQNKP